MKAAIIGANGQLGADVSLVFGQAGHEVVELTHADLEVADPASVRSALSRTKPEVVVNTAAMHHVEKCEDDPARSFAVNGLGARNLALAANELDFALVHLSTDYVFDGEKAAPYVETDAPRPLNVYGNTKLCGEYFVRTLAPRHYVVRVSGIYGTTPCRAKGGNNFVTTMLRLARQRGKVRVVDDEMLAPTYTRDIARQLAELVNTGAYGLYHCAAQGGCSWHRFAAEIFRLSGLPVELTKASPDEFPMKVPRPKYSVLENQNLKALGLDRMPDWAESLKNYFTDLEAGRA